MNQIEAHYQQIDPTVRGLFYTLGFNIGNNSVAQSVMNPSASDYTDALWSTYSALTTGNMTFSVKNRRGDYSDVSIAKNSYATGKDYVDEYFAASGDGLTTAFRSIVEEIILQSRYYPTHLEGGNPDFAGYVEFEDVLGKYMEVKDIKGILLGDTLYDGHMMASKLADTSDEGLGTVDNPTALGDEFIGSVKNRLGINSTAEAQSLVAKAFAAGQLKYVSATEWSNYIGWYAKADGTYVGFWDEDATDPAPADAVYKIKSYGFLGETTGSIKNSDMMYMTVQVRTDIATGEQAVLWKIPASLVPMVTYKVTLEGTNVDEARNVEVAVENADTVSPIRLVFESGLRSDLNELNITRITDAENIAADGVTRQFWTNYFDISAPEHDDHVTTLAEFTPSKENERFYYTFDSAVHKLVGGQYVLVGAGETLDPAGEYYHRRYIFTDDSTTPIFLYERMSAASIGAAVWNDDFTTITGDKVGAYVVPAGTPARELQMYDEQKSTTDDIDTRSAHMVFHPYLTEHNHIFYVDMNLGNNGLLEVTPAQGIKLSKTVDIVETGTSVDFRFRITVHNVDGTPYTGTLDGWTTALDEVPLGEATAIAMSSAGTYTVDLSKDQTFWLTGLPTGATYTVEELGTNTDYKIKSVHVNGVSTGTVAAGTVAAYYIDEVSFVNTAVGEGDLVITKSVVDENGAAVDVNDSVKFTAEVTLAGGNNAPVSGRYESSAAGGYIDIPASGTFTVTLAEGESFVVRGIPGGTRYTVAETNIPAGFTLNTDRSSLTGVVDATANDQALIVNTYDPAAIDGRNVTVDVTKAISGNRTAWRDGESYRFLVKRLGTPDATIADFTIDAADADKKYSLTLAGESYAQAGTYRYSITEAEGTVGGITYDTVERRFAVVVADADMDGDLEITAVNSESHVTVTSSGNTYTVAAAFNNVYQPTGSASVTIDVQKAMVGDYRLNGFQFALYDGANIADADEIQRSTVTDAAGKAHFTLTYPPTDVTTAGVVHTYYLAEVNTGNPNITYDTAVYKVEITVKDNGDGTISATPVITAVADGSSVSGAPVFTNTFTPSDAAYVTLTAQKNISGDRVLNAHEFEFVIEALTNGAPMPTAPTAKNAADGSVVFDTIEFTAAGTYKYKIYESNANAIGGFDYDGRFYEVTVTVTDSQAKLYAAVSKVVKQSENESGTALGADEIITFTNAYDATDATVTLAGEKILTGKTMQADEFTFVLTPDDAAYPMPAGAMAKNDANGDFAFGTITYAKAGVYTYTLTERATGDTRYDFDTAVYRVTVTVTDNSRGTLTADVALQKNGLDATAIVFRNGFVPTPITYDVTAQFNGKKVLDGRPLVEGEFEFRLINAINGVQIGETVKNDAAGTFRFPALSFPEAGTYFYKIAEVVGDEKGVSYDTSTYHIHLEVAQNDDGVLYFVGDDAATADVIEGVKLHRSTVEKDTVGGVLTEVVHYEDISVGGSIVFNNSYQADPAYVTLEATKLLEGRDLIDGEFKFDLHETDAGFAYDETTVVQDDVVLTLNADGTGNVTFMPMAFDAEGDYYYVIVEDEPAQDCGVTSDDTVYKIRISVYDNHAGDLIAKMFVNSDEITGSTADTIKFRNVYEIEDGKITIFGNKTLTGRDLQADEFSFELYDKDGKKLETVKNAADGLFIFSAIPVNAVGEYVYTVRETKGSAEGVTYDGAVYTVTATVTDNLDGTYKIVYSYAKDGAAATGVAFANTYTAPEPDPAPTPTPEDKSPLTGDSGNLWLWFALMLISGGAIGTLAVYGRKRKTD